MKKIALSIIYKRLARVAKKMVLKHCPLVIAITGSVGKTSAKEAIYHVLSSKFGNEVRANYGNLNAEIGIPLTILGYSELPPKLSWPLFLIRINKHLKDNKYPKYLVLEMGVEHHGDIKKFCDIARPDTAVITAATPAHVANFNSLQAMKEEKISLATEITSSGSVFYNADDNYLSQKLGSKYGYGINNHSYCFADEVRISISGNKYQLNQGGNKIEIHSRLFGSPAIYADLAAACVANKFSLTISEIKTALESRKPTIGRMNILPGINNTTIIDDTYNANPASVMAAIDAILEVDLESRKVIILGNMNELGNMEQTEHIKIAKYLDGKIDVAILAGHNAKIMAEHIKQSKVYHYENRLEMEKNLYDIIEKGDVILIKASQNRNFFEETTKKLLDHTINPSEVLVRQSKYWSRKKNAF